MAALELSGLTRYSQHFIIHNFETRPLPGDGVTERLDFLAKMR
jgi:hypothetical protein